MAYDHDDVAAGTAATPPNDTFHRVLRTPTSRELLGAAESIDVSVTHWAGQYVDVPDWPRACGPVGYSDPPVVDARGKDCNAFHGDYTGLAVDSAGRSHVVWTGLNRAAQSPQLDPYVGGAHDASPERDVRAAPVAAPWTASGRAGVRPARPAPLRPRAAAGRPPPRCGS